MWIRSLFAAHTTRALQRADSERSVCAHLTHAAVSCGLWPPLGDALACDSKDARTRDVDEGGKAAQWQRASLSLLTASLPQLPRSRSFTLILPSHALSSSPLFLPSISPPRPFSPSLCVVSTALCLSLFHLLEPLCSVSELLLFSSVLL